MQTQKLYDELMQQQLQKGREQGLREAIQQLCATRGLKLTATWRAKLDAETRAEVLMRWLARAVTAAKAREIFSDA